MRGTVGEHFLIPMQNATGLRLENSTSTVRAPAPIWATTYGVWPRRGRLPSLEPSDSSYQEITGADQYGAAQR
jgi:hypothetical protein